MKFRGVCCRTNPTAINKQVFTSNLMPSRCSLMELEIVKKGIV